MVCESRFRYSTIDDISIESGSWMNGISKFSFANCKVKTIVLPKQAHIIDRFAFFESSIGHVSIEGSGNRFVFDQRLLLIHIDTSTVIRYFGTNNDLLISRYIEVLGQECFCRRGADGYSVQMVRFEQASMLYLIEESRFAHCPLREIIIPRSVMVLGKSCFQDGKIECLTFENESHLVRIEDQCFENYVLASICIPENVARLG
jgi:hypothetical protein